MNALQVWRSMLGPLVAFGAVACGSEFSFEETHSSDPAEEQILLKGYAVFGHEVRTVRPCGADEPVWAIDSTGVLWDVHGELTVGMEPYQEVFAVVRGSASAAPTDGFGAEYPGSFVVKQVVYAAGEGFGCELDMKLFDFRVSGNEPFWTLSLFEGTAELSRMGVPDQRWNGLQSERSESGVSFLGESSVLGLLEVHISEGPCRDSMSGAFYGYQASVLAAREELEGCALRGAGW